MRYYTRHARAPKREITRGARTWPLYTADLAGYSRADDGLFCGATYRVAVFADGMRLFFVFFFSVKWGCDRERRR